MGNFFRRWKINEFGASRFHPLPRSAPARGSRTDLFFLQLKADALVLLILPTRSSPLVACVLYWTDLCGAPVCNRISFVTFIDCCDAFAQDWHALYMRLLNSNRYTGRVHYITQFHSCCFLYALCKLTSRFRASPAQVRHETKRILFDLTFFCFLFVLVLELSRKSCKSQGLDGLVYSSLAVSKLLF